MAKKYKYKKNKKLINKLKKYWKSFIEIESEFYLKVRELEDEMIWDKDIGIKDIEFPFGDDGCMGIGNVSRTMELIHGYELDEALEKEKN